MKNRVWNLTERIEELTGQMVHEIPALAEKFVNWQDGKTTDGQIVLTLTNYLDGLLK